MMKKTFFATIVATLVLAVFMMPGQGLANPGATAYGEASIGYNSLTFSRTDLNWLDPTGLDTRGSLAGVSVTMGGIQDPYHSNTIDGAPWVDISVAPPESTHNFSTPADTVEGSAYTNVTNPAKSGLFASGNVALTHSSFVVPTTIPPQTPLDLPYNGIGSVDLAQAFFGGLFTVPIDGVLQITASYSLFYQLGLLPVTGSGAFANAYVDAGLALYDFNGIDPITGQSPLLASGIDLALGIQPFLSGAINGPGPGSGTGSSSGTLTLAYNLSALDPTTGAPMVYDFEAFVTAKSAASVPEPATLILLVSGMLGLAAFRKKFV